MGYKEALRDPREQSVQTHAYDRETNSNRTIRNLIMQLAVLIYLTSD